MAAKQRLKDIHPARDELSVESKPTISRRDVLLISFDLLPDIVRGDYGIILVCAKYPTSMETHTFYKEDLGGWYIDLPQYLEQGGSKGDLAMVAGADTMLDIVADGEKKVTLTIDTKPFDGADELLLTKICEPSVGGGYYLLKWFERKNVNHEMWLCAVTEFVFQAIPERIYIKRA